MIPNNATLVYRQLALAFIILLTGVLTLIGLNSPAGAAGSEQVPVPPTFPSIPSDFVADPLDDIDDGTVSLDLPYPEMITLVSILPAIAQPGSDVSVAFRVTNTTAETLEGLMANLEISPQLLSTRSGLASWLSGTMEVNSIVINSESIPELPPGASQDFVFRIPVENFRELTTGRGPRPMLLTVTDEADEKVSQLNSLFLWDPGVTSAATSPARLGLSFIAPVTGALITPGQVGSGDYPPLMLADNARLAALVAAANSASVATGNPAALALAVDPALVAFAGTDDATGEPSWADSLASAVANGIAVYPLPPFDPDLAALAHADISPEEFQVITNAILTTSWHPPSDWHAPIAWPADWLTPDQATIRAAAPEFELFIAPAGRRARWGTVTGLDALRVENHSITILINDDRLATSFYRATDAAPAGSLGPSGQLQNLLAELMIILDQNTETPPHLLVALPRDWHPNQTATAIAFSTLAQTDWLNLAPLSTLINQPVPTAERFEFPTIAAHPGELPGDEVRQLVAARANLAAYISASLEPDTLIYHASPALMLPLSVAWRDYFATAAAGPEADVPALTAQRSALIQVSLANSVLAAGSMEITGAGLTLISNAGSIPFNIQNNLPSAAVVRVVLTPQDSRLLIEDEPLVTVPAGATQLVYVPVTAIASGDVLVTVELQSESGATITTATDLELRIRAGWETASTLVIGLVLAAMFIAGIIRTVKRGRAPSRTLPAGTTLDDPLIFDRSS